MRTLLKPRLTGSRDELQGFPRAIILGASANCVGTVRVGRTALPTQKSCNGLVPHLQPEPALLDAPCSKRAEVASLSDYLSRGRGPNSNRSCQLFGRDPKRSRFCDAWCDNERCPCPQSRAAGGCPSGWPQCPTPLSGRSEPARARLFLIWALFTTCRRSRLPAHRCLGSGCCDGGWPSHRARQRQAPSRPSVHREGQGF